MSLSPSSTTGSSPVLRLSRRRWLSALQEQRPGHYLLLLSLLGVLATLMVYPLAVLLTAGLRQQGHLSFFWFAAVLEGSEGRILNPFTANLLNSLLLAAVVTFLANLIAMPLALISQRYDFRGKGILSALVLVPMVLPPFVGAIGMRQLLGKFGSLTILCQQVGLLAPDQGIQWLRQGGFWACAVLIALGLYPIAYLNLQAALANIDPAMVEAAENLGARRWRIFRRITLPLAMPGVFAGSTIVFIWAFTELGTPLLLDYRYVVSRDLFDLLATASGGNDAEMAAKVTIVLSIAALAYVVGKLIFGRQAHAMTSKAAVAATTRRLNAMGTLLAALPFLVVTCLAVLPHVGVVLYSVTAIASEPGAGWGPEGVFGWYRSVLPFRFTLAGYRNLFVIPEIYQSVLNSLEYAAISALVDLFLGVAIAWVLVRTKVWGRTMLDTLAMLPLAVPGLVMAFGYLLVSTLWPFHGAGYRQFPLLFLVVAYSMRRLPYLVRSAAGGLQQTSVTLEEAAANLGSSPLRTLWKVTLPLITANLVAGALLTFAFAMLEVSDSLILAQLPQSYPITKTIYALGADSSAPDNIRNACALGVMAMGLLTVSIVGAGVLMGKRLGAIFRA